MLKKNIWEVNCFDSIKVGQLDWNDEYDDYDDKKIIYSNETPVPTYNKHIIAGQSACYATTAAMSYRSIFVLFTTASERVRIQIASRTHGAHVYILHRTSIQANDDNNETI